MSLFSRLAFAVKRCIMTQMEKCSVNMCVTYQELVKCNMRMPKGDI